MIKIFESSLAKHVNTYGTGFNNIMPVCCFELWWKLKEKTHNSDKIAISLNDSSPDYVYLKRYILILGLQRVSGRQQLTVKLMNTWEPTEEDFPDHLTGAW